MFSKLNLNRILIINSIHTIILIYIFSNAQILNTIFKDTILFILVFGFYQIFLSMYLYFLAEKRGLYIGAIVTNNFESFWIKLSGMLTIIPIIGIWLITLLIYREQKLQEKSQKQQKKK